MHQLAVDRASLVGRDYIETLDWTVEEIEEGVLRIINGDVTHRFEVRSSEFGGLAYRVNQLVAVLTGEEEETEEESRSHPKEP